MVTSYKELSALFRLVDPVFRQIKKGLGAKIHVFQNGIEIYDEQLEKYLLAFRAGEVMTAQEVAKEYHVSYGNLMSWSHRGLLPYYQLTTTKGSLHLYIKSELTDDLWVFRCTPQQVNNSFDVYNKILNKLVEIDFVSHLDILQQYLQGKTTEQIAQELDVTKQRVWQIIQKATKGMLFRMNYILTTATINQKYKDKYIALQDEYQKLSQGKSTPNDGNDFLDRSIQETILGDSTRIVNSLSSGKVNTIKDLIALKSTDLRKFRNLGNKSIKAILAFAEKYHLKFADQI